MAVVKTKCAGPNYVEATTDDLTGGVEISVAGSPFPLPRRTSPVRVALFGDSTANAGLTRSAGGPDVQQVVSTSWASGTTDLNVAGDKWQLPSFYPRARLVASGGVGGQTTAQMLTRDMTGDAQIAFSVAAILATKPDVVILRGGSINDYIGGAVVSLATGLAQHQQIIQRVLQAGIPVVDCGIYGYSGSPSLLSLAEVQGLIVAFNAGCRAYAAQYPGKVEFAHCAALVGDGAGGYAPYMSIDGTHLSWFGQHKATQVEAVALSKLFGTSSGPCYDGVNLMSNQLLANPPTLVNTPTGYIAGVANGTRQNYRREVIAGRVFWTYEVMITAANSYADLFLPYDPSASGNMGIVSGDQFGIEFDYYIAGLDGFVPTMGSLKATLETKHSGGGLVRHNVLGAGALFQLPEPVIGHAVLQPIQYGDSSANFTAAASSLHFSFTVSEGAGAYKVGVSGPRIVKL